MNKTIRNVVASAAILFMATGCASKCTFEEFKEDWDAAVKEAANKKVTKTKIKGSYKDDDFDITLDGDFEDDDSAEKALKNLTLGDITFMMAFAGEAVVAEALAVAENKDATYYCGAGFKIEKGDATYKFDKYTNITSIVDANFNVSVSYSYENK